MAKKQKSRTINALDSSEEKYPSVELAYAISLKSYEWVLDRVNAVDEGIEKLLALASSINLAVIAVVSGGNLSFHGWFWVALSLFAAGVVVGMTARLGSKVILITPANLYSKWLHFSPWEFRQNMIYFVGQHFEKGRRLVNRKGAYAIVVATIFLLEGVALALWLVS
jgi:hypothetical protein